MRENVRYANEISTVLPTEKFIKTVIDPLKDAFLDKSLQSSNQIYDKVNIHFQDKGKNLLVDKEQIARQSVVHLASFWAAYRLSIRAVFLDAGSCSYAISVIKTFQDMAQNQSTVVNLTTIAFEKDPNLITKVSNLKSFHSEQVYVYSEEKFPTIKPAICNASDTLKIYPFRAFGKLSLDLFEPTDILVLCASYTKLECAMVLYRALRSTAKRLILTSRIYPHFCIDDKGECIIPSSKNLTYDIAMRWKLESSDGCNFQENNFLRAIDLVALRNSHFCPGYLARVFKYVYDTFDGAKEKFTFPTASSSSFMAYRGLLDHVVSCMMNENLKSVIGCNHLDFWESNSKYFAYNSVTNEITFVDIIGLSPKDSLVYSVLNLLDFIDTKAILLRSKNAAKDERGEFTKSDKAQTFISNSTGIDENYSQLNVEKLLTTVHTHYYSQETPRWDQELILIGEEVVESTSYKPFKLPVFCKSENNSEYHEVDRAVYAAVDKNHAMEDEKTTDQYVFGLKRRFEASTTVKTEQGLASIEVKTEKKSLKTKRKVIDLDGTAQRNNVENVMGKHASTLNLFWMKSLAKYLGSGLVPEVPRQDDGVYPVLLRSGSPTTFKAGESKDIEIHFAMLLKESNNEIVGVFWYEFSFSKWRIIKYESTITVTINYLL
jgi:hypothetical protein